MSNREEISYVYVSKNECPECGNRKWFRYRELYSRRDCQRLATLCVKSEYLHDMVVLFIDTDYHIQGFSCNICDECISCGVVVS
jgi:hypothetical protein